MGHSSCPAKSPNFNGSDDISTLKNHYQLSIVPLPLLLQSDPNTLYSKYSSLNIDRDQDLIIQDIIEGKRGLARRRTSWLKNLHQWFEMSTPTLFRSATDKVKILLMTANVLGGQVS